MENGRCSPWLYRSCLCASVIHRASVFGMLRQWWAIGWREGFPARAGDWPWHRLHADTQRSVCLPDHSSILHHWTSPVVQRKSLWINLVSVKVCTHVLAFRMCKKKTRAWLSQLYPFHWNRSIYMMWWYKDPDILSLWPLLICDGAMHEWWSMLMHFPELVSVAHRAHVFFSCSRSSCIKDALFCPPLLHSHRQIGAEVLLALGVDYNSSDKDLWNYRLLLHFTKPPAAHLAWERGMCSTKRLHVQYSGGWGWVSYRILTVNALHWCRSYIHLHLQLIWLTIEGLRPPLYRTPLSQLHVPSLFTQPLFIMRLTSL